MLSEQKQFVNQLVEITNLYSTVKQILVLSENLDEEGLMAIGPFNELRNAFDHVMRGIANINSNIEKANEELPKIKEHLLRAGYDCYEIAAINLMTKIQYSSLKNFDSEIITKVFPEYYSTILPEMIRLKIRLAGVRSSKTGDNILAGVPNNDFKYYHEQIVKLGEMYAKINAYIPNLENAKQKRDGWDIKKIAITVLATASVMFIGNSTVKSCVPSKESKTLIPLQDTTSIKNK